MKEFLKKIKDKLKPNKSTLDKIKLEFENLKQDKKKLAIVCGGVVAFVIILIILITVLNRYPINKIGKITDADVKELYSNTTEISCTGDLHFDIYSTDEYVPVEEIRNSNLINYLFKYLDRNNLLNDNLTKKIVDQATYKLFYGKIKLFDSIVNFQYGEYLYNTEGNKVVRRKMTCSEDETVFYNNYSDYSIKDNELLVDIHMGYAKLGNLYDLDNEKLGKFVGDKSNFDEAFKTKTYYRIHYVKSKGELKVKGIEIISK